MRRAFALLVVGTLAIAGCADAKRPPIERVSGTIEPSSASAGGPIAGTPGAEGADGVATSGGAGTTAGTEGSEGTAASSPAPAGSPAQAAAATAALNEYLDALETQDFKAAQRMSTGGPRFMATVRDVVARYNTERDGVTKLSYSTRSFTVESTEPNRVTFAGTAVLKSTTSGPAGKPRSDSSTFTSPVLAWVDGSWRVTDFDFDGAPLAHFPFSSHSSVGGVDLILAGGLSFGTSTAVVIDLVSDSDRGIKVDDVHITYVDGTTAESTIGALVSKRPAALYFLFDRVDAAPASWSATVTVDEGTGSETTERVVLRF